MAATFDDCSLKNQIEDIGERWRKMQIHLRSKAHWNLSACGADRGLNRGRKVILTEMFQDVTCGRCLRSKDFRL